MASPTSPRGPHVLDQLESYLLGGLDHRDEFAVEQHLLQCSACRHECDDLADAALMVSRLPAAIVREIVEATAGGQSLNRVPAQLSVSLADRTDGSVEVQAVLVGVQPGLDIELLAVTADQRVISVSRDRAGCGSRQVAGLLPAAAGQVLLFIAVDSNHHVLALTLM